VATVVIVVPFALWTGIPQFVYDTVGIYADLLTRHDSANLNGLASVLGYGLLPGGVLLVGLLATVALFTLRRPRDYGDLLVAGAGLLILVCCFGKQAFLNYYFNAAIALLFVVGSGRLVPSGALRSPLAALMRLLPKTAPAAESRAGVGGRDPAAP
jgi:hypothetical protein